MTNDQPTPTVTTVTILTTPNCQQCRATAKKLEQLGVPYETVDIRGHAGWADWAAENGYRQAPIVVTPQGKVWTGYKPDNLSELS